MEEKTISLSQCVYVEKALEYANMLNCKPVHIPIVSGIDFRKNVNKPVDKEFVRLYQSHIGTHMWVYVYTCPDLGFAVSIISGFSFNPSLEHMIAVQQVYRYLQTTKDLKIVYRSDFTTPSL